jgi:hypothetical protein
MDRAANMFSHIGSHGIPFDGQAVHLRRYRLGPRSAHTTFAPMTHPETRRTREQAAQMISGRTAVIADAASGIGQALAQRLSAHSAPVAIADVDERG